MCVHAGRFPLAHNVSFLSRIHFSSNMFSLWVKTLSKDQFLNVRYLGHEYSPNLLKKDTTILWVSWYQLRFKKEHILPHRFVWTERRLYLAYIHTYTHTCRYTGTRVHSFLAALHLPLARNSFYSNSERFCSLGVCCNELLVGNFIWGVPYVPWATKLSSNKNAKSNLTMTPDNLDYTYLLYLLGRSIIKAAK